MRTVKQELENQRVKSEERFGEEVLDRKRKMLSFSKIILNDEFFQEIRATELYISEDFSRAYYGVYSRDEKLVVRVVVKSSHTYRESEYGDSKHQYFEGGNQFCFASLLFEHESQIIHHYEDPFDAALSLAAQFGSKNPTDTFVLALYDQGRMEKWKEGYPERKLIRRYLNGSFDEFIVPMFVFGLAALLFILFLTS